MHAPLQPILEPSEDEGSLPPEIVRPEIVRPEIVRPEIVRPEIVRPGVGAAIWRGLRGRCPACGRGRLFASFLKQVQCCADCREPLGHLRSDDAAPWLTILVVGHIVVPLMLSVDRLSPWPTWLAMTVWPLVALALAVAVLPRAKGALLSVIWVTRAPGSERD